LPPDEDWQPPPGALPVATPPAPGQPLPLAVDPFQDGFDPFADLLAGVGAASAGSASPPAGTAQPAGEGAGPADSLPPMPVEPARGGEDHAPGTGVPEAAAADVASAFLRGMGLGYVKVPAGEEALFLERAGLITQTVVETLMVLLMARAEVKRELRAEDRTMLGAHFNNPLKMMTDPAEALRYLFDAGQQQPGFLPPVQAVQDAARELRAHDIALVAGMRAAVLGTIRRFDPQAFEKAAAKAAGPLAINRRAKSWDAFVEAYAKLDRDAADSIDRIFQNDFLRAYTEQVRLLEREPR
jgi:type VI secretion system FHA domain protein